MNVKVMKLHPDAVIPTKAYEYDSGFDLYALEDTLIGDGETKVVPTGLAFEIPPGYELQVRPRSGMSTKTDLRVILGTIDCQYRGDVGIIVHNLDKQNAVTAINKGDRIAQGVFQAIPLVQLTECTELSDSDRGANGLGSTGV